MQRPRRLLIKDVLILTLDPDDTVHERGDVLIEDGLIVAVGSVSRNGEGSFDRVIDAEGRLLVPGFVNAHTHSPANPIQGMGDGLSHPAFMWMNQAYTAHKTPREIYVSALLGCLQMLATGTTSALDHFPGQACGPEDVDAVMQAYRDSGMRVVLGLRFYDAAFDDIIPRDTLVPEDLAAELRRLNPLRPMATAEVESLMEHAIGRWHGCDGRLGVFPAPSNPERCSEEGLLLCRDLAERHGVGIHTHLLETQTQARMARERYGRTMVRRLADLGLLTRRLSCAHTIWVEDDDIDLLAESGAVVVHNPESNLKIGAGIARIPEMKARGVRLAIGTDGAGTNDNLIMHEAVRLAAILHRPMNRSRKQWLSARDVVRMATLGGAAALQEDRIGSIEVGKRADLVLYRLESPWWVPVNDPIGQLVFAENGSSVDTVLVDGRVLVEGGRITAFDAEALLAEARAMMREIRERNRALFSLAERMGALFP